MQHDPILKLHENKNAGEKYTPTSTMIFLEKGKKDLAVIFILLF